MIFVDDEKNDDSVIRRYGVYHPWHGGNNPEFDRYSGRILDLKDGNKGAVDYFFKRVDPTLRKGIAIVAFPSKEPDNYASGLYPLCERLARNGRIDASRCLKRLYEVEKRTQGGSRSIQASLDSIEVVNVHLIRGRNVLLLDDVTTSGNSLKAGRQLLLEAGASYVQCAALG